jgi:hypothetical protein
METIEQYCKFEPVMISLRDYFAGQAIIGLLSMLPQSKNTGDQTQAVAQGAYFLADAMLEARKG